MTSNFDLIQWQRPVRKRIVLTNTGNPCRQFLSCLSQAPFRLDFRRSLGLIYPPQEEPSEEERGLLSRTAAGNQALVPLGLAAR